MMIWASGPTCAEIALQFARRVNLTVAGIGREQTVGLM
jgi:hypothetical protein